MQRLRWHGTRDHISAHNDQVWLHYLEVLQCRVQRGQVAMDVVKGCTLHGVLLTALGPHNKTTSRYIHAWFGQPVSASGDTTGAANVRHESRLGRPRMRHAVAVGGGVSSKERPRSGLGQLSVTGN